MASIFIDKEQTIKMSEYERTRLILTSGLLVVSIMHGRTAKLVFLNNNLLFKTNIINGIFKGLPLVHNNQTNDPDLFLVIFSFIYK